MELYHHKLPGQLAIALLMDMDERRGGGKTSQKFKSEFQKMKSNQIKSD